MKRKYLILSTLIQGPKQPGNDIDVFLEPLLEEMEKLWNDGELVWDEFKQECFTLRAMIFVSITDYPGGFSLSGQMKGKKGCLGDTQYVYLRGYAVCVPFWLKEVSVHEKPTVLTTEPQISQVDEGI